MAISIEPTYTKWNLAERNRKWKEDVKFLANELPKRHKNLFFKTNSLEFKKAAASLCKTINSMTDAEAILGMAQLIATVGDNHTILELSQQRVGFRRFPIWLRWFDDGLFVEGITDSAENAIGCKVKKIGKMRIERIYSEMKKFLPHESTPCLKQMSQRHLNMVEFLYEVGAINSPDTGSYCLEDSRGTTFTVNLGPFIPGLGVHFAKPRTIPAYSQNLNDNYQFEWMKRHRTLYIQYNCCKETEGKPFGLFSREVLRLVNKERAKRIIIDLRNNGGGNSKVINPLISGLHEWDPQKNGCQVFAIIGKKTGSSAILNSMQLKRELDAIFIGKPTGGKPNHYGDVKYFGLPNSKISIQYSTKYFKVSEKNQLSIIPDIRVKDVSKDYFAGKDPVMKTILSY